MKLELKHLAPYLPYGLKIMCESEHVEGSRLYNLLGISAKYHRVDLDNDYGWSYIKGIKPILRPLSYFGGKRIIGEVKKELDCSHNEVMELLCLIDGSIRLDQITYGLYLILCSNLIDFNGLIEKGLAIDKNTL